MTKYGHFLSPSESHLVVGQRKHEKRFQNILMDFKNKSDSNLVIITSPPGFGKSSLIGVFEDIAKTEMVPTLNLKIPMGKGNQEIFQNMYKLLLIELKEPKKGLFKRAKEVDVGKFTLKTPINKIANNFMTNFTSRPFKGTTIITLDSFDRAIDSGQVYLLEGMIDLIKAFKKESIPLLFVLTLQDRNYEQHKALFADSESFVLDRLDFSDAKLLLSKAGSAIGSEILQKEPQLRDDLVKQSDRSPFNLFFMIDTILWAEDKLKRENQAITESSVKDLTALYIRNFALRQFIKEAFDISEKEEELIQLLTSNAKNAVPLETIQSAGITREVINDLAEKNLLVLDHDFVQFTSYAVHEKMGGIHSTDLKTEAKLLLQIIEADLMSGVSINKKVFERLNLASISDQKLEDQSIPNRVSGLYQTALGKNKYSDAFKLAVLTGNFLMMAQNSEGAGLFFEECATKFRDTGEDKINYSLALYKRAIEAYRVSRSERQIRDIAQRLAISYLQLAEKAEKSKNNGLARSYYYQAVKYNEIADEKTSLLNICQQAIKTYSGEEKNASLFFKRIQEKYEVSEEL